MIRFHPHAPPIVPCEDEVVAVLQASGRTPKTIRNYVVWVRRFYLHCTRMGLAPVDELTLDGATQFANEHVGHRTGQRLDKNGRRQAKIAVHAWSSALRVLGHSVPEWFPRKDSSQPNTGIVAEYLDYRSRHGGVSASTLVKDEDAVAQFLAFLKSIGRRYSTARVQDIDAFVVALAKRYERRTVSNLCSTLRSFLRFLQTTGRTSRDLASLVVAPKSKPMEKPPRVLAWSEVRRLIRAVDQNAPGGLRDYAVLLLMATYGLGAGEIINLNLEDIDWACGVLRARRRKTGVEIRLPLLPAVAHAVASYIEKERPLHAASRGVFVTKQIPHDRISTASSLLYIVRKHARTAGIETGRLGSHTLRHSYACWQIDNGVNSKVVADILGHRHPSSTSAYTRVALNRLREVALSVPG